MNEKPNWQHSNQDFLRIRDKYKARGYTLTISGGPLYVAVKDGNAFGMFETFAQAENWIDGLDEPANQE